jgi:hypothetical protein
MNASNLAVVFQPGLVSTRNEADGNLLGFPGFDGIKGGTSQEMGRLANAGAGEHARGKQVLEFLIEQQESFVLGLDGPIPESAYAAGVGQLTNTSRATRRGSTDLNRRASERSVEKRKQKKSGGGASPEDLSRSSSRVKRSKTLPKERPTSRKFFRSRFHFLFEASLIHV